MTDATTLRALAERVERADADNQGAALLSVLGALNLPAAQHYPLVTLISVGAFLDAAASLVPEGWKASVSTEGCAAVWQRWKEDALVIIAAPPALALCAAALRARAAMMEAQS